MFYLELYLAIGSVLAMTHLCFVSFAFYTAFYTAFDINLKLVKEHLKDTAQLLKMEEVVFSDKHYLLLALSSSLVNLVLWPVYLTKVLIDNLTTK